VDAEHSLGQTVSAVVLVVVLTLMLSLWEGRNVSDCILIWRKYIRLMVMYYLTLCANIWLDECRT